MSDGKEAPLRSAAGPQHPPWPPHTRTEVGTWKLLGLTAGGGGVWTEGRIVVAGSVAAVIFLAAHALAGDRTEPLARQLWSYLHRPHRYTSQLLPMPVSTTIAPGEDAHHAEAPTPIPPLDGQPAPAALPRRTRRWPRRRAYRR